MKTLLPFPVLRQLQRRERAIEACNPQRWPVAPGSDTYRRFERIFLRMRGQFWMANSRRLMASECCHGLGERN